MMNIRQRGEEDESIVEPQKNIHPVKSLAFIHVHYEIQAGVNKSMMHSHIRELFQPCFVMEDPFTYAPALHNINANFAMVALGIAMDMLWISAWTIWACDLFSYPRSIRRAHAADQQVRYLTMQYSKKIVLIKG